MFSAVLVTVPNDKTAQKIAKDLFKNKLIACANLIPNIKSFYYWENKLCRDMEVLMILKTRKELFTKLRQRIKSLHPYKIPEIIALPILQGNAEYLKWIKENTGK